MDLSIHRWRGNLWVDGWAPWAEFDWIGQDITHRRAPSWGWKSAITPLPWRPRSTPRPALSGCRYAGRAGGRLWSSGFRRLCPGDRRRHDRAPAMNGDCMSLHFTLAPEPEDEARETGRLMFAGPVDLCEGRGRDVRPAACRPAGGLLCRSIQRREIQSDQCADRSQDAGAGLEHAGSDARDQLLRPGRRRAISSTCRAMAMPRRRWPSSPSGRRC